MIGTRWPMWSHGPAGRSRCSRRSAGRSRAAPAGPGVVAWSIPASSSSSRRRASSRGSGRSRRASRPRQASQDRRPSRHDGTERGSLTAPMLSCGPTCRPASRGGSAIGAASAAGGRAAPPTVRRVAIAIPLVLFPAFLVVGLAGVIGVAAAYNYYSQGLPDPARHPEQPHVRPADDRLRPDRQDRARELRRVQARGRRRSTTSRPRCSTRRPRSRTRTSGPTRASTSRGFVSADLDTLSGRPRGASTITQQLVRARLLPAERLRGHRRGTEDPGDHPVDPPDRGLPGRGRQAGDHHRLPEPELLRQPELRDRGRGPDVLRQGPQGPDTRPGGHPRRHPPVADEVRPREERRASLHGRRQGRRRLPGRQDPARRPRHDPRSSSGATTSSSR